MHFDGFYESARRIEKLNISAYNFISENNKITEEKSFKAYSEKKEYDTSYNTNAYNTIINCGFDIYNVEKCSVNSSENKEIYYCKYKDWIFNVYYIREENDSSGRNYDTLTIFSIKNIKTMEEINYTCDLYGVTYSITKLNNLLSFMDLGIKDFIEKEYSFYFHLSDKLTEAGFNAVLLNEDFKLNKKSGPILIDNKYYLFLLDDISKNSPDNYEAMYATYYSDTFIESSTPNLGLSLFNDITKITHEFYYNEKQNFNELCDFIKDFSDECTGQIGYLEDNIYYNNDDVHEVYKFVQRKSKNVIGISMIDETAYADKHLSRKKGLEIYKKYNLSFESLYSDSYVIEFEYNKKIDSRYCHLKIYGYISEYNKESILNNEIEISGSFLELFKVLIEFVSNILSIHGIKID